MTERRSLFFARPKRDSVKASLGEETNWLITMSDLTLLLLCAFLVWHVIDKYATVQSLLPQTPTTALPNIAPLSVSQSEVVPPFLTPAPVLQEEDAAGQPSFIESPFFVSRWELLKHDLEKYTAANGFDEVIELVSTQHELVLTLKDTVLFASGKADLWGNITPVLGKVAALARNHPDLSLEVLGHTDDVPIATSEFPSNWELSAARASRVARRLIESGIAPTRVSAHGYAYFRPILPNTSTENRAINRRVEIRFYRGLEHGMKVTKTNDAERGIFPLEPSHANGRERLSAAEDVW